MDDLIERLRARAEASGGDKLLEEAAAALEAAREDAGRYRWLRAEAARYKGDDPPGHLVVSVTYNPRRADGAGFTGILKTPRGDDFDAAIDQARGKGGRGEGVKNANG